jgi:hypothetical protein
MNSLASQRLEQLASHEAPMLDHFTPELLLTRDKAAAALSKFGYPTTKLTLGTLASRGGGPIYRRYGRRALYRWGDLVSMMRWCSPRRAARAA